MAKLLELTHERLGWPSRRDIMEPKGAGPGVIADLAKRKLETAIGRLDGAAGVKVGVLASNPSSNRTEDPLAIVCDFAGTISDGTLRETLRLGWSFSRSPMLITVEPSVLRAWTCWKRPVKAGEGVGKLRVEELRSDLFDGASLSEQAARALHWVELASGSFFRNPKYSRYFQRNQRADHLMLEDLKGLRCRLLGKKLPQDICHDLIARVIFIEFLFQRKDSQGNAALDDGVLRNLRDEGVLSRDHGDLGSILESHGETYRFFRELNDRFNGDLFPGKGETPEEREEEWKAEMRQVRADPHLNLLAEFVRGKMEMATGHLCLWKRYAFVVIPLEFISSIYEEFVKAGGKDGSGVHYTPGHVVDFMLDEVLPWKSKEWNIKILDPACGSGIFLVKAYQRLVHRWKEAHADTPKVGDLRKLLEEHLFGVDTQGDAVRVASFSLYLAMCDEIEPKHVWERNVRFPRLREKRLVESDFFAEDRDGFQSMRDKDCYDLVIGNPPWGHKTETEKAKKWARNWGWSIPNRDFGPLFLGKAAVLARPNGRIGMLQPAGALLFNRHSPARTFREKLFSEFRVEKIINLSSLRFGLFRRAIGPTCAVIMRAERPVEDGVVYVCPKPRCTKEDDFSVVIEPSDINYIYPEEAARDRLVWTVLAWGGRRDLALIRKLGEKPFATIRELERKNALRIRNGFKRGIRRATEHSKAKALPILEDHKLWEKLALVADCKDFPVNTNLMFERIRKLETIYNLPLVLMKESWTVEAKRFKAVLVEGSSGGDKLLFSQSFNGIRVLSSSKCEMGTIGLAMNSTLAVYFFLLTGARMGNYRPTLLVDDVREFPLPEKADVTIADLAGMTEDAVDSNTKKIYKLNDAEWVLVDDLFSFTLRDFKEGSASPGRQSTRTVSVKTRSGEHERLLGDYCDCFMRVLQAGFGKDRKMSATIFTEDGGESLPVRLVGIHLGSGAGTRTRLEGIDSPDLIERLKRWEEGFLKSVSDPENGGIFYRRVARIYDTMRIEGKDVPTVFIVKPDQVRYWTRSMALRDADEVAGDIMLWRKGSGFK